MSPAERELMMLHMKRLGTEWDKRLRSEWLAGRPARWLAAEYGLELATIEALIPQQLTKRTAA